MQYESFLDSPPQAPILEAVLIVFSECSDFCESPLSKLQKFEEGGGIERVMPGYLTEPLPLIASFWNPEFQVWFLNFARYKMLKY